jgi:diphosphomevalonate decarboxylase
MNKSQVVKLILGERLYHSPGRLPAKAFAPTNIALCKYWGKRDQELNLPVTSSLSISLGNQGATTEVSVTEQTQDVVLLNGEPVNLFSNFGKRLLAFLDLFRVQRALHFKIDTQTTIPIAAGLASSACGFAALVLALNKLFNWQLDARHLSILARLGSGSACRSIWPGFVEWNRGVDADGMDSHGNIIPEVWPELRIGLLIINHTEKNISSREAMQRTVDTSVLYPLWPEKVNQDLIVVKKAIYEKDFFLLGKTAESNALTMHGLMLSACPPISYFLPETVVAMQKIGELRQQGAALYFTQDAGPNLKLLFLSADSALVKSHFPLLEIVNPFGL